MCFILKKYFHTQSIYTTKKMSNRQKNKIKRKRSFSTILIILLTIAIGFVNTYYYSINHMVSTITDITPEQNSTIKCNVYALKDSNINSLSSKEIHNVGVLARENGLIKSPFKQLLKKQYGFTPDTYSYQNDIDLVVGLMDKQLDIIVISQDEVQNVKNKSKDFIQNTKLIGEIELGSALESKPVDVKNEPFNVLILGVDIRKDEGTIKTDTRTDTVMVASFNPKTMNVALISIPRDSYLMINGEQDKLTHAGNSGLLTVASTIEDLLDIQINYFVKFNFTALVQFVDAIGGINIHVDYPFCEQNSNDQPNAICLKPGLQHLDGEQALAYARHRKTVGDAMRNHAQQQVIQGITDQLMSLSLLTKFDSITNVLANNMLTNFKRSDMYTLASLAPRLGELQYHNLVINGEDDSKYFNQYGQTMSIIQLDPNSIQEAKDLIHQIDSES